MWTTSAAPLDALLVDAALGPLRRFMPDLSTAKFAGRLVRRPATHRPPAGRARRRARPDRLAGVAASPRPRATVGSPTRPGRDNPLLRRARAGLPGHRRRPPSDLVADADLDWRDAERVRFLVENLIQALAPSNVPLVNPASAKAAIDTAGLSLVRGAAQPGARPAQRAAGAGRWWTPRLRGRREHRRHAGRGRAADRDVRADPVRAADADQVREVPLLIVPPTINKYYALDLAPGRSLVEYLVRQGQQVFMISWRNPDARHADWGLDAYVRRCWTPWTRSSGSAGASAAVLTGVCSGGIIASLAAAHLAATGGRTGWPPSAWLVTVLDNAPGRHLGGAGRPRPRRRGQGDVPPARLPRRPRARPRCSPGSAPAT